jgi:hypothetical protein
MSNVITTTNTTASVSTDNDNKLKIKDQSPKNDVSMIKSLNFQPSDFIEPNSIEALQSSNKRKSEDETSETNNQNSFIIGKVNYQKLLEEKLINFRKFLMENLNTDILKPICTDLIKLTTVPFITFIKLIEVHILPAKGQMNIWLDNKIEFLKIAPININQVVREKILRYLSFFIKFVELYKENVKKAIPISMATTAAEAAKHINKKQNVE